MFAVWLQYSSIDAFMSVPVCVCVLQACSDGSHLSGIWSVHPGASVHALWYPPYGCQTDHRCWPKYAYTEYCCIKGQDHIWNDKPTSFGSFHPVFGCFLSYGPHSSTVHHVSTNIHFMATKETGTMFWYYKQLGNCFPKPSFVCFNSMVAPVVFKVDPGKFISDGGHLVVIKLVSNWGPWSNLCQVQGPWCEKLHYLRWKSNIGLAAEAINMSCPHKCCL